MVYLGINDGGPMYDKLKLHNEENDEKEDDKKPTDNDRTEKNRRQEGNRKNCCKSKKDST